MAELTDAAVWIMRLVLVAGLATTLGGFLHAG
jgi:hypothetical protein